MDPKHPRDAHDRLSEVEDAVAGARAVADPDPAPGRTAGPAGWLAPLHRFVQALTAPPAVWIPAAAALLLLVALVSVRALEDAARVRALETELAATQRSLAVLKQDLARVTEDTSRQGSQLTLLRRQLGAREEELATAKAASPPVVVAAQEPLVYQTPAGSEIVPSPARSSALMPSAAPDLPEVVVLAPNHVGRTVSASPALYWRLSGRTDRPLAVSVVDPERQKTVLDTRLRGPHRRGYGRISLGGQRVALESGRTYQWFVSVLAGDASAPNDPLATGLIERVSKTPQLEADLRAAGPGRAAHTYARRGIWYDAVDAISKLIANSPKDSALRAQREALLKQVALPEASDE